MVHRPGGCQAPEAFWVRIVYYDLVKADPHTEEELGAEFRSMDDLLGESDFVTLHVKFTGDNDEDAQPPGVWSDEADRLFHQHLAGRMVDEEALAEAIASKKIGGAGLDVFYYEPFQPDSPLAKVAGDNVILTPHVAGTPNAQARVVVANDLLRLIGRLLKYRPSWL